MAEHTYNVIFFDFRKAFNKTPHSRTAKALKRFGLNERTLSWFPDYLVNRSQRVKVDNGYYKSVAVTSGLVQGSCLEPTFFILFIDKLLRHIKNPTTAFVDNVNFLANETYVSLARKFTSLARKFTLCLISEKIHVIDKCSRRIFNVS